MNKPIANHWVELYDVNDAVCTLLALLDSHYWFLGRFENRALFETDFHFTSGVLAFFASLALAIGSWKASRHLHEKLIENILHCPMSFFDTTPTGRILNRCTKDVDVIDMALPSNLRNFLWYTLVVLGTVLIIAVTTPAFLVVIIPLAVVYFFIQVSYPTFMSWLHVLFPQGRRLFHSSFATDLFVQYVDEKSHSILTFLAILCSLISSAQTTGVRSFVTNLQSFWGECTGSVHHTGIQ